MDKTLFIASFPDLSCFDFSKTNIRVGNIDNSDYYFENDGNYIHSYIDSLKSLIGTCDILFVPATDSVISTLAKENVKCIVLYPNISCKDSFIADMHNCGIEDSYISMVEDSWSFIISRLEKQNYDYKFVMGEEDKILDVLGMLLSKRDSLGVSKEEVNVSISDSLVNNIFSYCLINENEIKDGKPIIQSTFCEGIRFDYLFSKERLSDKYADISSLIDSIDSIDEGISVGDMNVTKGGIRWTNSFDVLERTMALGVSSGVLILPFPREYDHSLKGSLPYVIKSDVLEKNAIF